MFGIDGAFLLIVSLASVSVGGFVWFLMFRELEVRSKIDRRFKQMRVSEANQSAIVAARVRDNEIAKRRKTIQDSLKELEEKHKKKTSQGSPSLKILLQQTGWNISVSQFYLISAVLGIVFGGYSYIAGAPPLMALGVLLVFGLGVPRWIVSYKRKQHFKAFIDEFPNALDMIVRSIRSGLPVNDALHLIAAETREPARTQFKKIVESQQLGLSISDACARLHDNIPLQETNFFATVISIQAQAGGNLSDALGNLSRILRERKKMKSKIDALSMEAKASAAIIGALPFVIISLVYVTTPDYIVPLFNDPRGQLILGASAIWMTIGILVMRKMSNFDV